MLSNIIYNFDIYYWNYFFLKLKIPGFCKNSSLDRHELLGFEADDRENPQGPA